MDYKLQKLYEQHLLEEGRRNRYYSMFKGVIPDDDIERLVKDAVKTFKREDRIIWYLRWYKLVYINNQQSHYEKDESYRKSFTPEEEKQYQKQLEWKEKFFQYTLKQNKKYGDEAYNEETLRDYFDRFSGSMVNTIEQNIRHFLSLPIEEIQNYQFEWQVSHTIRQHFNKFEQKWRDQQAEDAQWIDITDELGDEIEVVHRFDDGFYWLDLKKEYCELEGDAMGHCGNSADHRTGDTVLSLRKIKKEKGKVWSRPSVTFILREGGLLGEMKGRENKKPHEKYHPHILTLLKIKKNGEYLVQDIGGGGYLPESNFDLDDLTGEQLKSLYKSRPDLRPLRDIYNEDGLTEVLIKKIKEIEGFISIDRAHESVLFDGFDNVTELLDTFGDPFSRDFNLKIYLPYVTGEEIFEYESGQRNGSGELKDLYTTTLYKKSELKNKLKAYIFFKYGEDAKEYDMEEGALDSADNQFDFLNEHDDEVTDLLDRSIDDGLRSGSESEMVKAFKSGLEDLTVRSYDDNFEFGFKFTDDYGYGKIYYELSIKEALDLYEEFKKGDHDDITHLLNNNYELANFQSDMSVPYYGFSDYDEDSAIERFEELLDEEGILDYSDPDQTELKLESAKKYLKFF